ncbi:hypothetical protein [Caulobacter sp. X]|uniref:hypothetical protein n=1 Tax=Caulobacter sp. X TaxID=2048901 RepID=UPI000C1495A9|nr:hypothetical protein [Caulobacter sp. X]PIB95543.1 hypothetical protein CSW60_13155 [Caulobacter sp. X]
MRLAIAAFIAVCATAVAARAEPCDAVSLTGLWELTSIDIAEPGASAFYKANPYEYLRFGADGRFAYLAGPRKAKDVGSMNALLDGAQAAGPRYDTRVINATTLVIFRNGQPFQGFVCSVDKVGEAASEMVWTQMEGAPSVRRVHHRLK